MALPSKPNPISSTQITTELGITTFRTNLANCAGLAGKAVGDRITIPNDYWGKAAMTSTTVESILSAPSWLSAKAIWFSIYPQGLIQYTTSGTHTIGIYNKWSKLHYHSPETANIGRTYWARATKVSGDTAGATVPNRAFTGGIGTAVTVPWTGWVQLSQHLTAQNQVASVGVMVGYGGKGTVKEGVYRIDISTSATGSPIVHSYTWKYKLTVT